MLIALTGTPMSFKKPKQIATGGRWTCPCGHGFDSKDLIGVLTATQQCPRCRRNRSVLTDNGGTN